MRLVLNITLLLAFGTACSTWLGRRITTQEAVVPIGGDNPPVRCSPECSPTERCDFDNRSCVPKPCGGRCRETERCDRSGPVEQCVAHPRTR